MVSNGLIRAKEGHRIEHQGEICKVAEAADKVETRQVKPISYKGNHHVLHVCESNIRMIRVAKPKRKHHSRTWVALQ